MTFMIRLHAILKRVIDACLLEMVESIKVDIVVRLFVLEISFANGN